MILKGADAMEGLYHLTKVVMTDHNDDVVVMHGGRRYGGFRDEAHAGFFVRMNGWQETAVIKIQRRGVVEST